MRSGVCQALINEATQKAYQNVNDWMGSDPYVASQLRDGLRTLLHAFDELNDEIQDAALLLQHMLAELDEVLEYYHQLPGSEGEWECSALHIVRKEILRLIDEGHVPSAEAVAAAEAQLRKERMATMDMVERMVDIIKRRSE